MTSLPNFQWLAALLLDRMLICLVEGTLLAMAVTLLLRLLPKKNSRTRFAVWLAALLAILVLPLLRGGFRPHELNPVPGHALFTISSAWAMAVVGIWAVIGAGGLIRVAAGVWQLRRLRRNCRQLSPQMLGPELQEAIEKLRRSRQVSILVSERVEVPGAIGFFHPAIVLPPRIVDDLAARELKFVILHELAHLERWDDWSNLAQQVVKALLFFHPGVWWIERKLSLDREMACDDAVVARAEKARVSPECLATVAEKSFMRRQYALVQAAVDRVRQLSLRLASILDRDRPQTSRLWKPALPMVTAFALFCAFSVSWTPELVRLSGSPGMALSKASAPAAASWEAGATQAAGNQLSPAEKVSANQRSVSQRSVTQRSVTQQTSVTSHSDAGPVRFVPALYTPPKSERKPIMKVRNGKRLSQPVRTRGAVTAASDPSHEIPATNGQPDVSSTVVVVMTKFVVSRQAGSTGPDVLQVQVLELRWVVPANPGPKLIPRKT
jgi:beta-lactamase regulating signal transducer with metallopeptidase domain